MVASIGHDLQCSQYCRAQNTVSILSLKPSRELPQELIDFIVDHLHNDRHTLMSSSLIARPWVSRTRRYLFDHISISTCNGPAIYECLNNPLCTFRSSVKAVVVKSEKLGFSLALRYWVQQLMPLLSTMRLIDEMEGVGVQDITVWRALQTSTTAARITHITFRDVQFKSFDSWKETIQNFPSLTSIRYIAFSEPGHFEWQFGDLESTYLAPANLRHLEIVTSMCCPVQQSWSQFMWDWLLQSEIRLTSLRLNGLITISLNEVPTESLKTFAEYVRFLGPSLETFNLHFRDKHSAIRFYGQMDFMSNTGLREFEIGNICLYHSDDGFALSFFFLGLSRTWSHFPPELHLKKFTVVLEISVFDADSLDFFNYADPELTEQAFLALDTTLVGATFPNLEEVAFLCRMGDDQPCWPKSRKPLSIEVGEFLGQNLPKTMQKGILAVY